MTTQTSSRTARKCRFPDVPFRKQTHLHQRNRALGAKCTVAQPGEYDWIRRSAIGGDAALYQITSSRGGGCSKTSVYTQTSLDGLRRFEAYCQLPQLRRGGGAAALPSTRSVRIHCANNMRVVASNSCSLSALLVRKHALLDRLSAEAGRELPNLKWGVIVATTYDWA